MSSFEDFDQENPEVYRQLETLARNEKAKGKARISIKRLFEEVRELGSRKRLSNSYTADYARLIMSRNPELAGLFELRVCKPRAERFDLTIDDQVMALIASCG